MEINSLYSKRKSGEDTFSIVVIMGSGSFAVIMGVRSAMNAGGILVYKKC